MTRAESRKKWSKKWRVKNKLYTQEYARANSVAIKARQRQWYLNNRERIMAKSRNNYKQNQAVRDAQHKAYAKQHPEVHKKSGKAWLSKKRLWYRDYKTTLSCAKCGESHPACLDFHHRDSSTKLFNISSNYARYTELRVRAEIEKCDVLCANCHRKLHSSDIWP